MRKFTLGLNAVKNTDYIRKYFKQKFCKIKFLQKIRYLYLPGIELEGSKIHCFWNIKQWNGRKTFTSIQRPNRVILWGSCDLKLYIHSKIMSYFIRSIKINCNSSWETNYSKTPIIQTSDEKNWFSLELALSAPGLLKNQVL